MLKKALRILSLLLCAIFLCSCGAVKQETGEKNNSPNKDKKLFSAEEIATEPESVTSNFFKIGEDVYFTKEWNWENPELLNQKNGLEKMDSINGGIISCPDYPQNMIMGTNAECGEGFFAYVTEFSPENEYDNRELICRFDGDGRLINRYTYSELSLEEASVRSMVFVGNVGYFLQYNGDFNIISFDDEPQLLFKKNVPEMLQLVKNSKSQIFALVKSVGGNSICLVNERGEFVENPVLPFVTEEIFSGDESCDVYIYAGTTVYSYDFQSGETKVLMDLLENGMPFLTNFLALGGGEFLLQTDIETENSEYSPIFRLKEYQGKSETITLAITTEDEFSDLRIAVALWNREHPELRIEVWDYSALTGSDIEKSTKLGAEMTEGRVPDMLDLSTLPVEQYIKKGRLLDLSGELPELNKLLSGVKNSLSVDGKIYELCASFRMETMTAPTKFVENFPDFTYKNMMTAFDCSKCEYLFNRQETKKDFICWAVEFNMNSLIDWNNGKADFDSELFKDILRMSKYFPNEINRDEGYNESKIFKAENQLLCMREFYWPESIIRDFSEVVADFYSITGFPGGAGNGTAVAPVIDVGIMAGTEKKEECLRFLSFLLSDDFQRKVHNLPSVAEVYNAKLDEKSEFWLSMYPEWEDKIESSRREAEKAIDGAELAYRNDPTAVDIVMKNLSPFLAGEQSIEQTAENIQRKMSVYVNEQS